MQVVGLADGPPFLAKTGAAVIVTKEENQRRSTLLYPGRAASLCLGINAIAEEETRLSAIIGIRGLSARPQANR